MSDAIIQVENLSKKYVISHQQKGSNDTFRDVLANTAKSLTKSISLGGKSKSKFEDASKEEFWALKDVSFEINQGDRVGIIGRNGAGKSTLLKILSRITEPTSGKVRIKGRVASLLEVGTGFHGELTGRENIYLNGAILGMSKAEIQRKFDEIVAFSEVEKFLDTPVKRYSSGMYVRLAFAVAAHLEPEILIVDEVLAVGDAAFQRKCLGKMKDVGDEGRTVLFVSHSMSTITALCDRSIFLELGRKKMDSSAVDVAATYLAQALSSASNESDLRSAKREGTGKVKFLSLTVKGFDKFGESLTTAYSGCNLLIETTIECFIDVPETNVAIIIYDSNGYRIVDVNTAKKGDFIRMKKGEKAKVSFELENLLLRSGTYIIGLWIGRGGIEQMDHIEYAYKFNIEDNPENIKHVEKFPGLYLCEFMHKIESY